METKYKFESVERIGVLILHLGTVETLKDIIEYFKEFDPAHVKVNLEKKEMFVNYIVRN